MDRRFIAAGVLILVLVPLYSFIFFQNNLNLDRFNLLDDELTRKVEAGEQFINTAILVDDPNFAEIQKQISGQAVVQDFPYLTLQTDALGVIALSKIQTIKKLQDDDVKNQIAGVPFFIDFENVEIQEATGESVTKVVWLDTPVTKGTHGYLTLKTFRAINQNAEVVSIPVLDESGRGSITQVMIGMQEALNEDPDLICGSIGSPGDPNDIVSRSANLLYTKFNIPSVWSAGNAGESKIYSPANARFAIASIALTEQGQLASYSNFDSKDGKLMMSNIGEVVIDGQRVKGTSFSQPILCAMIAQRIEVEKVSRGLNKSEHLPAEFVLSIAINAGKDGDIFYPGWDVFSGYGHPTQDLVLGAESSVDFVDRIERFPFSTLLIFNAIGLLCGGVLILVGSRR